MENNNSTIPFLSKGKAGNYTVVAPDFEKGKFIETQDVRQANKLTFYGFSLNFEHTDQGNEREYDNSNEREYCSKIHKRAFQKFIEDLQKFAKEEGAEFILIQVTRNSQAVSWKWLIQAQCQFLVVINPVEEY